MVIGDFDHFCEKGKGGPFMEGGNSPPGGTIPIDTSGGLLSADDALIVTRGSREECGHV